MNVANVPAAVATEIPASENQPAPTPEPAPPAPRAVPAVAKTAAPSARPAARPVAAAKPAAPAKAASAAGAVAAKKPAAPPKKIDALVDPYADLEELAKRIHCPSCLAKIPPESKLCPKCGEVFSKGVKRLRTFGLLIVLALGIVVPLVWPKGVWPRKIPTPVPGKEGFAVINQTWKPGAGNNLTFVVGVVTNHADRGFYGVKVEVELLNRTGAPVGTTMDQIQFVDAHKVWNFKALVIDPEAVSAGPAKVIWQH